ncbi:MAG TPA: hypothetical protein VJL10_10930 [Anaerolineales bacterium]|nr:hypothetical protein [Anaerolineales bacterium]
MIEYDEKGKFFTDVVTKVPVPSILQTTTHLIRGLIHVIKGARFKTEMEGTDQFIAVTDANVYDVEGKIIYQSPFLAVQKKQIVWVMPVGEDENKVAKE